MARISTLRQYMVASFIRLTDELGQVFGVPSWVSSARMAPLLGEGAGSASTRQVGRAQRHPSTVADELLDQ